MAYLDLEEAPDLWQTLRLLSNRRFAWASFRELDHPHTTGQSLSDGVRELVQLKTNKLLTGPIRLLTQLRYLGYYFSPLNLYYCFSDNSAQVEAIVAEVSNTPWKEHYRYVLDPTKMFGDTSDLCCEHAKSFHVSPFMHMDTQYHWQLTLPAEELKVRIDVTEEMQPLFSAEMQLQRRPLTDGELLRTTCRFPLMTAQIVKAIYWQAFRLWWKKCPYYPHP